VVGTGAGCFTPLTRREEGIPRVSMVQADDMTSDPAGADPLVINEMQLLLAEKRTSLAVLRTGIAVLALPLSVLSVLIATSRYYDVLHVLHFLIPLGLLNLVLIVFGGHLILRSITQMHRYDQLIHQIKREHSVIGKFIE
jgi:uncharacterized membrane protein YidH (DUF202 family)